MLRGLGGGGSGVTSSLLPGMAGEHVHLNPEPTAHGTDRNIDAKAGRMLAAGKEIRAHLREPITSGHSCLYDPNGLPL